MTEDRLSNPYDLDTPSFNSEKYLEKLLKNYSLKQVMDTESNIIKDTQSLHSEMQTLVYENYNKFISATDTIRKMKTDFKKMEKDMDLLKDKMNIIIKSSENITDTLDGTRTQLSKLSEKHCLLKRLQFLSSLPSKLRQLLDVKNYNQAVQDYLHAHKVLQQYGDQPSFKGILNDTELIIAELKETLKNNFQIGNTAQNLTETGELLLQLNEDRVELADKMLEFASRRLFEQTVMIQDQTERDMIEFIDLSIEGFLNDLTLVITSYYDMFLSKEHLGLHYLSTKGLHDFVDNNLDKYLLLVRDRVESEIGKGDTQVMLRALDRLHRRLLAMQNMCKGIQINKNGLNIIIGSAQQLAKLHLKTLKEYFSDMLSSIRLSLVSGKTDSNVINLNELISNLYVSTIEKVKSVLQDLLIFLHPDWSFNIKSEPKGRQTIERIRENLLIHFLRHICKTMNSFAHLNLSSPPNLLLILSKTCLEMEQNGVHLLISMVDDLYEIDSENSTELTHETELMAEIRETAQNLLDSYVRLQGVHVSQMIRKSVESRDWLNCLEPRSVRAVMKRIVTELTITEKIVGDLYENNSANAVAAASSDSSRKTHFSNLTSSKQQFRSNWSNYTQSQLESTYTSNIHKLFSERIEIFTSVEFSKASIITGIIKIALKTFLESVRLRTFSKFGLQQIQVDTHYLQQNLWRFVADENLINFLLDEILGSAVHRCLDSILMEPNVVEIICERG